ncbi:MAG TPA: LysR family transcriptional regulator [Paraburkholderia sp.]|jgi:DNA-binding transcriptional LysR family regulator|nr:LysR family transcriptional regulator [Paraburkholderia sp.]
MTPDQLITFAAVAEHRNISRAALALHLSQPAVSGQLRLLQEEFGEPLYLRDGRGIRLTPTGEQLAVYATRMRDLWRDAHAYRDALRGLERGTLRVGASTTPASYLLPYLIAAFHRQYAEVRVETASGNTAEIVAMLGSLDVAMIEGPVGSSLPPDTAIHPWRDDEIVAIVPRGHPLAGEAADETAIDVQPVASDAGTSTLEALGTWPLVLREAGSGVRQVVERAFARAGVPMRVALEIAGVEGVKEAVRAGMGIGFVSAMTMRHEDAALCRLRIAPEPLARRFSILVPHAGAASRVAQRFLELCMQPAAPL